MKLHVINSNSQGNCYILEGKTETLLIECGVRFDKIKKALKFNFKKVVGCLVTHEHKDHCFAVNDLLGIGIDVFSMYKTHEVIGTNFHHRAKFFEKGIVKTIGQFTVMAFDVRHDCADPVGFLIHHPECGKVVFITDTFLCEYKFSGLNNVIIEANYSLAIIDRKLKEDKKFLRDRVIQSHMNIETTLGVLKANDLSQVNNIVLIHLSDSNSNAADFKKSVQDKTGKNVFIAEAGLTIPFDISPF